MTGKPNGRPHLPSLSIKGFRGIETLDIPRLGRVTLLAGRNGVGKTAVLEAVRVYASRGRERVLSVLLRGHEEFVSVTNEDDHRTFAPNPAALFHGRVLSKNSCIEIGSKDTLFGGTLKIDAGTLIPKKESFLEKFSPGMGQDPYPLVMQVSFADRMREISWFSSPHTRTGRVDTRAERVRSSLLYRRFVEAQEELPLFESQEKLPPELNCRALGPGLPNNGELSELWDEIALTADEDRAVQALNLVLDGKADRVTMIGDGRMGRRVAVKLRDFDKPVPLRSLGDGAARLFGTALALAGSRNGFLIIDEAENGIHHSVHDAFWRMVLRTAKENDVQVFAATHSFDCVRGFAHAAVEAPDCEGLLVRLERQDECTRAVVYSVSELETAAEQGIEVR